eukprot:GHVH01011311.1.p1 GENE.GHVH01011311.1~~GHVH01011311.1.p1  ORF type:complete len:1021 (-),score=183.02 GHVH01011311.1:98-3160(-)
MPLCSLQARAGEYHRKTLSFLEGENVILHTNNAEESTRTLSMSDAVMDCRSKISDKVQEVIESRNMAVGCDRVDVGSPAIPQDRESLALEAEYSGAKTGTVWNLVERHFEIVKKTNRRHHHGHPMSSYIQRMQLLRVAEDVRSQRRFLLHTNALSRDLARVRAEACRKQWDIIEKRREEIRERERRERMRMLRETNFDEYVKMVRETKDNRLMELLDQTDQFLSIMGGRVETQKSSTASHGSGTSIITENKKKSLKGSKSAHLQQEYYNNTHLLQEKVKQPSNFTGTLMPYQLAGVDFLVSLYNNRLSGILADEMGLGKTVQTIALLAHLLEVKHNPGPHLIIVPLSTLPNWISEFDRFCGEIKVLAYKGTPDERHLVARKIRKGMFNVLITTYDYILKEKQLLSQPKYRYIIVDEGHRMKNKNSKFHMTLSDRTFHNTHRLLLTGTPLQNNLGELWSLLNFILPKIFTSTEDFTKWFEKPFSDTNRTDKSTTDALQLSEEEQFLVINRLHAVLRPFLLRRIKSEVLGDLPDKLEYIVRAQLTPWQKVAYSNIKHKVILADSRLKKSSLNNTFMQLRKVVNHPYLFENEYWIGENLLRVSAKFELLDRMIQKLVKTKHKVLIFCQMTQLMDVLSDFLEFRKIRFFRLDGAVTVDHRQERMEEFNDPSSEVFIFMLSTRAGGLGVNLQAADTVIIFDSDWNPHQDLQAQARAHRMGQKNEVRVFRFVTVSGIEEAVLFRSEAKLSMDAKIIQSGAFHKDGLADADNHESRLREAILGKSDATQGEGFLDTKATTPEDLNRYLARNDNEENMFNEMDRQHFNIPKKAPKRAAHKVPAVVDKEGIDYGADDDLTLIRLQAAGRIMEYEEVPNEWTEKKKEETPDLAQERRGRAARHQIAAQFIQEIDSESASIEEEPSEDEDFRGPPVATRRPSAKRGRGRPSLRVPSREKKRPLDDTSKSTAKPKKRARRMISVESLESPEEHTRLGTPNKRQSARIAAQHSSVGSGGSGSSSRRSSRSKRS